MERQLKTGFAPEPIDRTGRDPDLVVERSEEEFTEFQARIKAIISEAGLDLDTAWEPALRHQPSTDRGRKTVARLLDTALDLVAKEGIRATNTRSIAREAGVNIATLYQYFDDVDSLLKAAALRDQAVRSAILSQQALDLASGAPLRGWVETTVKLVVEGAFATDHHRAVMTALQAIPALRPIPRLGWETGALMLATAMEYRFGGDAEDYWLPYARAVQSASRLVADDAVENSPEDLDRIWQVTQMGWEYLLARIPDQPPAGD
jgi:AcrR family transcriptional regulator